MRKALIFGAAFLLLSLAGAGDALAQTVDLSAPDGAVQGLLDIIRNSANNWDGRLHGYAVNIFWSLAVIQFVITFFPLALKNADFGEIAGELVRSVLVIGFFAALLMYSREWASAIVDSFREAGAHAAGFDKELLPGDMFATAVEMADLLTKPVTINPFVAVSRGISSILILISFAFIAAFMFVTLVESYIVINASVLFMGFGGSQWTREYAIAIFRYAVSVGAKLFVLTLIVGIIMQSAVDWKTAYNGESGSILTLVGLALVCAYLAKTIPDLVQGLISGVSPNGGTTIGSMAAMALTGGAGVAVGATAAGGAAAATGATGAAGGSVAGGGSNGIAGLLGQSIMGAGRAGPSSSGSDGLSAAARTAGQRTGGGTSASPPSRATGGVSAAPQASKHAANNVEQSDRGGTEKAQGIDAAASVDTGQAGEEGAMATASASPSGGTTQPGQMPAAPPDSGDGSAPIVSTKKEDPAISGSSGAGGLTAGLSAAVRGLGIMSALSVPGMENAAYAGSPAPSAPPEAPSSDDFKGEASPSDPVNLIQPAADQSPPTKTAPPKE